MWNVTELTGYVPKTTFWDDFSIADKFGKSAVQDTYNRAFKEWRGDVEYLTELVMVLNHKIWQWHEKDEQLAKLYNKLWQEADTWAMDNLSGDDFNYYWKILD